MVMLYVFLCAFSDQQEVWPTADQAGRACQTRGDCSLNVHAVFPLTTEQFYKTSLVTVRSTRKQCTRLT